jgi:hypothetical protein
LSVKGNRLIDEAGTAVQLRGVNVSSWVYACVSEHRFYDGPVSLGAARAIASWGANAVRLQLNEDCWLGINGAPAQYSGINYQNAVVRYVNYLQQSSLYVILSLAWSAPGSSLATSQQPMPDEDHAPAFWTSVAYRFGSNTKVLFDLYNEPNPANGSEGTGAWACILRGGKCPGVGFTAAGMQELVDDVRATGASNTLLVGGPSDANHLDRWLHFAPHDPLGNLVASIHIYDQSPCNNTRCWSREIASVAKRVPVITGEIGERPQATAGCSYSFSSEYTAWAEAAHVSYLAFDWDTWRTCDALITDYGGTPTSPYGQGWNADFTRSATPTSSAGVAGQLSTESGARVSGPGQP